MEKSLDKIREFWGWFVKHQEELVWLPQKREEIYPKIIEAIKQVQPGLVCDFEIGEENKKVVISADGDKALFPMVMRVVGEAPLKLLPGWQVIAFRQPQPTHFNLQFADVLLSSDTVMVKYQLNVKRKLDVTIFIEGWDESLPGLDAAGLVILDNTIGEYNTEMRIGKIQVKAYTLGREQRDDWLPLIRLPKIMEELFGKS